MDSSRRPLPTSDQLDLWDGSGVAGVELRSLPWSGRSPRELTRVANSAIFKAQAGKSTSDFVRDENQYDLWLPVKKAPPVYGGAPLLIPF